MSIGQAGIGRRGIGQFGIGDRGIPSTPDFFGITVDTTKAGSASDKMIIPLVSGVAYDFSISWGDGVIETFTSSALTNVNHVYSSGGIFDIQITGAFPRILFNNGGDRLKLLNIANWGNIPWKSMSGSFYGCSNMEITANDTPDLSVVADASSMLRECTSLTSGLDNWDTSSLLTANLMLTGASSLNSDISAWDVSSITIMNRMLDGCNAFNSDISAWDVSSVTNMNAMLRGCSLLNPDLSAWDISLVASMANMLNTTSLSTANLDLIYNAWSLLSVQSGIAFGASGTNYTIATSQAARDILTGGANLWTITDAGGI